MAIPLSSPLVALTAEELSSRLSTGSTTSVELVKAFLAQIDNEDKKGLAVNAIISACPREIVLERARQLDEERKRGETRSQLHGVPIVIKDGIVTDEKLGMTTTGGAAVFRHMKAKRNATVVDRLMEAGMIVLAKTNMTEFCGLKSNDTPIGWCAVGGQTLSPFRQPGLEEGDQPTAGGSSSGSAVALPACFSPLSLAIETSGSVVWPASVNGVYGIKLAPGSVPDEGVFKLSERFDAVGAMAKTPHDLGLLLQAIHGEATSEKFLWTPATLKGIKIAVTDIQWGTPPFMKEGKWGQDDIKHQWAAALDLLRREGTTVVSPAALADADMLKHDGETLTSVAYYEFPKQIERWISNFHPDPEVKILKDIVAWNEKHAAEAMPAPHTGQTELVAALASTLTPERATAAYQHIHAAAVRTLTQLMEEKGVDLVCTNSDSQLVSYAACAGWPIGTIPVGHQAKNGQGWGMFCICREGEEDVMGRFMAGWERIRGELGQRRP